MVCTRLFSSLKLFISTCSRAKSFVCFGDISTDPSFNSAKRPLFAFGVENCSVFSSPLREGAGESMVVVGRTYPIGRFERLGKKTNWVLRNKKKSSSSSTSDTNLTAALDFKLMADALCRHGINLNSARRRKSPATGEGASTTRTQAAKTTHKPPGTDEKTHTTHKHNAKKHNHRAKSNNNNNQNHTPPATKEKQKGTPKPQTSTRSSNSSLARPAGATHNQRPRPRPRRAPNQDFHTSSTLQRATYQYFSRLMPAHNNSTTETQQSFNLGVESGGEGEGVRVCE